MTVLSGRLTPYVSLHENLNSRDTLIPHSDSVSVAPLGLGDSIGEGILDVKIDDHSIGYGNMISMDNNYFNSLETLTRQNTVIGDTESTLHIFNLIIDRLKKSDEKQQLVTVKFLEDFLVLLVRDTTFEEFHQFEKYINKEVIHLVENTHVKSRNFAQEKIGGILAINCLINFYNNIEELPKHVIKFTHSLKSLLPSSNITVMKLAASTLGKLLQPNGTLTSDFIEYEIKTSIEWLSTLPERTSLNSKQENKKHAAILIISTIAKNSPYTLYPYINTLLKNIWRVIKDNNKLLRIDSAITLRQCLLVIQKRSEKLLNEWIDKFLQMCVPEIKSNNMESVHGCLLIYKEFLQINGALTISHFYDDIFEVCWNYKDNKLDHIRYEIYQIFTLLASFDKNLFLSGFFNQIMVDYLFKLKSSNSNPSKCKTDHVLIIKGIGDLAIILKQEMTPYLEAVVVVLEEDLSMKYKLRESFEPEIFYTIKNLVLAVGNNMIGLLNNNLLDSMLSCPLSDHMQDTLNVIADNIPSLENHINFTLLDLISMTLSGNRFKLPGSPGINEYSSMEKARKWRDENELRQKNKVNDDENDKLVVVGAIKILFTIRYKYPLSDFVKDTVILYIEHENPQVRELAALTASHLFVQDNVCKQTSLTSLNTVSEVICKLLTVAVTDIVPEIRIKILESMDTSFDSQLSQPDNVKLLFASLNDEIFSIRVTALKLIGRLAIVNPAYVVPSLRQTLLELLTELKYIKISKKNEECLIMLYNLIRSTKDVTKAYIEPILDILLIKLKDESSSVVSTALKTIGELSVVGGSDMKCYLKRLMPLIIDACKDQSNSYKRAAALEALGQLASASGYVIDPLLDYPELLTVLINILKLDSSQNIKRETVKLLGILGALDPNKLREFQDISREGIGIEENSIPIDISLLMQNTSPSNEEYYPTVVFSILLKLLKDPTLSSHHTSAVQAIVRIFEISKLQCVNFLGQIIPALIAAIDVCPHSLLEFYLQQLGSIIVIVKQHIRPYARIIFETLTKYYDNSKLHLTLINVTNALSLALKSEFKVYVPSLLTSFLNILETDSSKNKLTSVAILECISTLENTLEEYSYMIVPTIINLAEYSSGPVRKMAIITLGRLCESIKMDNMSSRIIHTCMRILDTNHLELNRLVMNLLSLLLLQMRNDFSVYISIINRTITRNNIQNKMYDELVKKILNNEALPLTIVLEVEFDASDKKNNKDTTEEPKKLVINQSVLKNTWDCSQQTTKEDWQEWIKRFSLQLLKESPSHALRACTPLATVYYPLARDLFNSAFASIWTELYTQNQEDLVQSLCTALSSPQNPPEIYQTLLNLVEFMEHDDKPLPIPLQKLGEYAERCHAYAKALHFKEAKFIQEPIDNSIVESLISINNQIYQNDAAIGILKFAQQHHDVQLQEAWYEKLQRWEDALSAYSKRTEAGETSTEVIIGHMRSLNALSDWDNLFVLASENWDTSSLNVQKMIAPYAASAAWSLGHWDKIEQYISVMKQKSPDREFFSAVLSIHSNNFKEAENHIFNARDLLVTEVSALVNESYNRAYNVIVRTQLITELEEIISYKKLPPNSEQRIAYLNMWNTRLLGCQKNVDIWQRALKVRSLVVQPKQDMETWIKFANLCRKSGKLKLAEKALNTLLEDTSSISPSIPAKAPPPVVYAQLKYLWATGSHQEALRYLIGFTSRMTHDLGLDPSNMIAQSVGQNTNLSAANVEEYTRLLARCFLKQGEWRVALQPNWRSENPDAILGSYLLATHFDNNWYKAWHNWALANFEVISGVKSNKKKNEVVDVSSVDANSDKSSSFENNGTINFEGRTYSAELIQRHVVPAIKGFFHSISLSTASSLQDTLRLLTLWFTFGGTPEAAQAMYVGFNLIKIDIWLEVLPQLISRIHQPDQVVSNSLLGLLSDLGRFHPQVMVNPLIVAIKSESVSRQKAALSIINKMKLHSTKLVEQAETVSNELIRVAVLWHELWYEGLEDASRQFFGEHNTEKMFTTLEPLHELLKREPETIRELSFQNSFGRDLNDAYEWVLNYKRSKDISNLNQAWDIYYNVFRRISRQLPQLQTLDLHHVSPKLLEIHDLELAVPGTYMIGKPVVCISQFDPILTVISSKQRPRKFGIRGSDGKDYQYLLKGHEDIRQDSLVMQLFGLVNTLLSNDAECFKRHLDIQKYSVMPLSPKSGLIGWVPNSDTFHVLIRDHRDSSKVPLNIEHWVMLQMAPDYDNLTLLQKIEVFQYAMDNTTGQDLAQVLWLKSRSSESWLDRRTVYTRSLAVMSMVGYILGLGDRHPSNLMLDRITGKVIHIDFGDCFEAAILREKFPEKVPFRLTRMLINAMEVSGIEGSFRITCENVMRVLRNNKESLMAILEAFAFDPLIQWGFDLPTEKIMEETGIRLPLINPSELLRKGTITSEEAQKLEEEQQIEIRNARALLVLRRITDKLTGNDISQYEDLNVAKQVDKLTKQAMSIENLCQHYVGWCPFW